MIAFSQRVDDKVSARDIYVPHPFTNWCLNPAHRQAGVLQHTLEGFRRSAERDCIVDHVSDRGSRPVVWCFGGSTSYCTGISRWQDSWPALLPQAVKMAGGPDILTINAGVGGWSSLQSLIRLTTWGPQLRPDLVIVYNTKNDLTPLWQGRADQSRIWPDYQNVMAQFGTARPWGRFWRRLSVDMVYGDQGGPAGLGRLDQTMIDTIVARHALIPDLVRGWNGKVLAMPEIIQGSAYAQPMDRLHDQIAHRYQGVGNVRWLDIKALFQPSVDLMQDKMHFNVQGCRAFAEILGRFLAGSDLLQMGDLP